MSDVTPVLPPADESSHTNSPIIIVFGMGALCGALIGFIAAGVMVILRIGCN